MSIQKKPDQINLAINTVIFICACRDELKHDPRGRSATKITISARIFFVPESGGI